MCIVLRANYATFRRSLLDERLKFFSISTTDLTANNYLYKLNEIAFTYSFISKKLYRCFWSRSVFVLEKVIRESSCCFVERLSAYFSFLSCSCFTQIVPTRAYIKPSEWVSKSHSTMRGKHEKKVKLRIEKWLIIASEMRPLFCIITSL